MKRKLIILIGTLAILGITCCYGINNCKLKQLELRNDAIENIENGDYQEAIDELNKDNKDSENEKLLKLASSCREMEDAYLMGDYEKAEKLINEIQTMEHLELVSNKVDSVNVKTSEKLKEINSLSILESQVNVLIENNSFKEAETLIEENRDKIDIEEINNKLITAKKEKENLQSKIEENKPIVDDLKAVKGKFDALKDKINKKGQVDEDESKGENA